MYPRILSRIRSLVLSLDYVATIHAVDEMTADDLTVYDLEHIVLSGRIIERQKDEQTLEYKYRINGFTLAKAPAEVVTKISPTGKVVFITVYVL